MTVPHPKAVVFDLGKVLLDFDYGRAARAMAPHSRVDAEAFRQALDQSPLLVRFESGQLTPRDMFDEVVRVTGYRGDFDAFAAAFGDIFTEIPEMIALHAEIRAAGRPTYIFSNTNGLAVDFIRRRHPFFQTFTGHVYSHEVGCMKPQPAIYEAVEAMAGCRGAELLYIDDREDNVLSGAGRDWQVVHHVSVPATVARVRRHLGLPGTSHA